MADPIFPPTGPRISCFFKAGSEGPTADQVALFQRFVARYPSLWQAIEPLLLQAQRGSAAPGFTLAFVSFPDRETADMRWELTYECEAEPDTDYTVEMRGWMPGGQVQVERF